MPPLTKIAYSVMVILIFGVLNNSGYCDSDIQSNVDSDTHNIKRDPLDLSPEEFFSQDLSAFSPAKKVQKLKNIPSAVYVMTAEDIRRSAADNLLDVFRLIPGIEVARVSSHEWAISSRGFNQVFGNKILLLVDGAPVETPIFNGILWENLNIPLDIIERIEVVRGPGATIWGTRAMNGLINVITKSSFTFPYSRIALGGGDEHEGSAYARVGGLISEHAAIQSYVKVDKYDSSQEENGPQINDEWDILTANVRGDIHPSDNDKLRVSSSFSRRQADIELNVPIRDEPFSETQLDNRENNRVSTSISWDHKYNDESTVTAELTNMYEEREDFLLNLEAFYSETELRHRLQTTKWNDLTYGVNFRFYTDDTEGSEELRFEPENRSLQFYRAFFHNEISLIPETLTLSVGSRFEENSQVDFSVMPTARLLWAVSNSLSFWAATSYTTGSPARVYDDLRLNFSAFREEQSGLPAIVQITGNRELDSEKLLAYEIGVWSEPADKLYLSATSFFFNYNDLVDNQTGDPVINTDSNGLPFLTVPLVYSNSLKAEAYGVEATADWTLSDLVTFGLVFSHLQLSASPGEGLVQDFIEDNPNNTFAFRSHWSLHPEIELDGVLRYSDSRPQFSIGEYLEADLRLAWAIEHNIELEIIGRNLFNDTHEELGPFVFDTPISTVERSFFIKAMYTF